MSAKKKPLTDKDEFEILNDERWSDAIEWFYSAVRIGEDSYTAGSAFLDSLRCLLESFDVVRSERDYNIILGAVIDRCDNRWLLEEMIEHLPNDPPFKHFATHKISMRLSP